MMLLLKSAQSMKLEGNTVMGYEPPLDDDIALGNDDECDECGNFIFECSCGEPDVMYDEYFNS